MSYTLFERNGLLLLASSPASVNERETFRTLISDIVNVSKNKDCKIYGDYSLQLATTLTLPLSDSDHHPFLSLIISPLSPSHSPTTEVTPILHELNLSSNG